jgi:hypothetical protein
MRRFSLSLDGTRAAVHSYPLSSGGCAGVNHEVTFPDGANLGGSGSCNDKISASGNYAGGFMGGAHDWVVLTHWDGSRFSGMGQDFCISHTSIYQATKWAGFDMGSAAGIEQLCFASNSDKWYTENISWIYGGGNRGTNQLIVNWVDKEAIMTTRHPLAPPDPNVSNDPAPGTITYQAFAGDFWVQQPAGKDWAYEDTAGTWHQLTKPADLTGNDTRRDAQSGMRAFTAHVDAAGILSITLPDAMRTWAISGLDISGKTIASRQARGSARMALAKPRAHGACIVRAVSGPESPGGRIVMAR